MNIKDRDVYIKRILAEHPEKDVQWANDQLERCLRNIEPDPNARVMELVLHDLFGVEMDKTVFEEAL